MMNLIADRIKLERTDSVLSVKDLGLTSLNELKMMLLSVQMNSLYDLIALIVVEYSQSNECNDDLIR